MEGCHLTVCHMTAARHPGSGSRIGLPKGVNVFEVADAASEPRVALFDLAWPQAGSREVLAEHNGEPAALGAR